MTDAELAAWITIPAIIIGPILAVQAQKFVEKIKETHQRKASIFFALMATRAISLRTAPEHVRALNMIDLSFGHQSKIDLSFGQRAKKEKPVVDAWSNYLDHLSQSIDQKTEAEMAVLAERSNELFTELLYAMSVALGYNFTKVHLKRAVYYPRAHSDAELVQGYIRDSLIKILSGQQPIPITVAGLPVSQEALDQQQKIQDAIFNALSGKGALQVIVSRANAASPKP